MKGSETLDEIYRRGDMAALRRALNDPPDFPNCIQPAALGVSDTPLEHAIYWSPLSFVAALLDLGADPNYHDAAGFPALLAALSTDRPDKLELLTLLLDRGADIQQRGINDWTPLHHAVALRDWQSIALLLDRGADPAARTRIDDCTTPLEDAERIGFTEAVAMIEKAARRQATPLANPGRNARLTKDRSMTQVTVAATQMACTWDREANVAGAESLVREAASQGAQIILIQELFETPYFCKDQKKEHFALAHPAEGHPVIARMTALAKELKVVLPVSFFERANNAYYNSLAVIDADGTNLGLYRKSHIPDGVGYQEKFYFNPGDTGFMTFKTRYATIGAAVCWDQWFPEGARSMALKGAEILFYPTAIGSEPQDASIDSKDHWQRTMQGHAAANVMPLVASNRIGKEDGETCSLTFYGSSFIADQTGAKVAEAPRDRRSVLTASFDLDEIRAQRAAWGLFRDRRPDLYGPVMTLDGQQLLD